MPHLYPLFVLATALLILTPGPNVALIVANSVAHGARYGMLTVAGTTAAIMLHMLVVGFGMGQALGAIGRMIEWVRWAGVAYLIVLGIRQWRAPTIDLMGVRAQPDGRTMIVRAVIVSLTNPKVLLFYGAFFPQFIAPGRPIGPQLLVLCTTYLVLAAGIDSLWALVAARARRVLSLHGRLRNRISGGLLVCAGMGLALAGRR